MPARSRKKQAPNKRSIVDQSDARASIHPNPTVDLATQTDKSALTLPHELDQDVHFTSDETDTRIERGHDDLEHNVEDTSGGGATDAAYRKLKP